MSLRSFTGLSDKYNKASDNYVWFDGVPHAVYLYI